MAATHTTPTTPSMSAQVPHGVWFNSGEVASFYDAVAHSGYTSDEEEFRIREIGETKVDLRCGPILRLVGTLEEGSPCSYRATMLVVTAGEHAAYSTELPRVTYQLGPADEVGDEVANEVATEPHQKTVTVEEGEFPGRLLRQEHHFYFWRYDIHLNLHPTRELKCKYYLNACYSPEYEFFLPAARQSMNTMFYSCNGYCDGSDITAFKGNLWGDVLRNHVSHGRARKTHYHAMVGGGDQIYADVIKQDAVPLKDWLATDNDRQRAAIEETTDYVQALDNFYLKHYFHWYGYGFMDGTVNTANPDSKCFFKSFPRALSTIPSVNIYDDHDIIDGYGSYKDKVNASRMFRGIGKAAFKYYLLFQHHTSLEDEGGLDVVARNEPSWIIGPQPGPYIVHRPMSVYVRLGQKIALVGLDCRTERTLDQVVSEAGYSAVFERVERELVSAQGAIRHLLVLLGVPIFYPRLVLLEAMLSNPATKSISKHMRKLNIGVAAGVVQQFDGSIDIIDDLNDHWCAESHKPERNRLVARLQLLAAKYSARVTILGGDVHLAALGRIRSIRDPYNEDKHHHHHLHLTHRHRRSVPEVNPLIDARLMFNVISSAIVNFGPPESMGAMLFNVQKKHVFGKEAEEDMVPLFKLDADGQTSRAEHHYSEFLCRRNYASLIPVENWGQEYGEELPVVSESDLDKDSGRLHGHWRHQAKGKEGFEEKHASQSYRVKFPGPVDKLTRRSLVPPGDNHKYHYDLAYPVERDGLAVTLHVERDIGNIEGDTQDYEVVVPRLFFKKDAPLPQTKVKHVS